MMLETVNTVTCLSDTFLCSKYTVTSECHWGSADHTTVFHGYWGAGTTADAPVAEREADFLIKNADYIFQIY